MQAVHKLPKWAWVSLTIFVAVLTLRYLAALGSGVDHVTAIRTYLFWGLVTIPVAILADMVGRSMMNYKLVQVAVAKVQASRR